MNSAPPITPNGNQFSLNSIKCLKHPNNQLVGICIDKNCKNEDKFMCSDCIFESHNDHGN